MLTSQNTYELEEDNSYFDENGLLLINYFTNAFDLSFLRLLQFIPIVLNNMVNYEEEKTPKKSNCSEMSHIHNVLNL